MSLETLYEQVGWPLYKKYGHAYDAFKLAINEEEKLFEGIEVTPEIRTELMANIRRRLTPQAVKLRAGTDLSFILLFHGNFIFVTLELLLVFSLSTCAHIPDPADIEVTCFSYEGIDAIITALKAGEAVSKEDYEIKVSFLWQT